MSRFLDASLGDLLLHPQSWDSDDFSSKTIFPQFFQKIADPSQDYKFGSDFLRILHNFDTSKL